VKEQLQRIGVECPVTHYDPRRPLLRHALVDIDTLERLVATLAERVERAEAPPTSSMSNAHGHFIERCGCGIVLAQCRCPGPKDERVSNNPCSHVSVQEARDGK